MISEMMFKQGHNNHDGIKERSINLYGGY